MKRILLGLSTLMLVGCPAPSSPPEVQDIPDAAGSSILEIIPEFRDGGYKVQADIKNYTSSDIKQLDMELIRMVKDGASWTMPQTLDTENRKVVSIEPSLSTKTVRFTALRPNTTYRIRWYAYQATGSLTPDSPSRISVDGFRDVPVGINDSVTVATMSIQLKDRDFSSTATLDGIEVIDGGYTYPGTESIVIGAQ